MILPIVRYGHPALRQRGEAVGRITAEVRQLVADMMDTMYAAHGIGLAAQQVGRPVRVTVLDVRGIKDRPSQMWVNDEPVDVDSRMPLVLINPELKAVGDPIAGPEGCLSFPEIYGEIARPEAVEVRALGLEGEPVTFRCAGLLAKAVQHEVDHLNGVLFIDRMSKGTKAELQRELDALMTETKAALEAGASRGGGKG